MLSHASQIFDPKIAQKLTIDFQNIEIFLPIFHQFLHLFFQLFCRVNFFLKIAKLKEKTWLFFWYYY